MILLLLFATGLLAGTIDAIAGGGGLISMPILLSIGMPPHLAFGTNKLQSTIGTFMATLKFYRHGLIKLRLVYKGLLFGIMGAIAGSVTTQVLSSEILRSIIPILLCVILIYTICSPKLGLGDDKPKMKERLFYLIFGFGLAFYDGFFGPGTGSFWVFALTFFLGYNLIKATAYTKLFNLNSNIVATICFAIGGNIDYRLGLCMALGQILGGRLGAHLAITKGVRLIRPLFLCIVALTVLTLVFRSYAQSAMFARINEQFGILPHIFILALLLTGIILLYLRMNKSRKPEMSDVS